MLWLGARALFGISRGTCEFLALRAPGIRFGIEISLFVWRVPRSLFIASIWKYEAQIIEIAIKLSFHARYWMRDVALHIRAAGYTHSATRENARRFILN